MLHSKSQWKQAKQRISAIYKLDDSQREGKFVEKKKNEMPQVRFKSANTWWTTKSNALKTKLPLLVFIIRVFSWSEYAGKNDLKITSNINGVTPPPFWNYMHFQGT